VNTKMHVLFMTLYKSVHYYYCSNNEPNIIDFARKMMTKFANHLLRVVCTRQGLNIATASGVLSTYTFVAPSCPRVSID
jgi:hypothetical protein